MLDALQMSLNQAAVFGFLAYMLGAAVLFFLFQLVYTRLTPHREFALIREGNVAAAIALAGAIVGFAIPASSVIAHSVGLLDFVVWVLIAAIVQLLAFFAVHLALRDLSARIQKGEIASGIYVAAVAVGVGLLNAACMTPN